MKMILLSLTLLLAHISQAQIKSQTQVKNHINKPVKASLQKYTKPMEKLSVGDTCYVTTNNLALYARPEVTSSAAVYIQRNAKVTVREVVNTQWILVDYHNQDVGVDGYVSRQSVSRKK